jgi:RHH-type proline utilization regulon transcriptional repressor/proline dehydrogenase/delta 1-pyrroline-5-carboxylate dehydrogenase
VGTHETLLAYLVRRLLENGANTSFVNRIADQSISIQELVADPVASIEQMATWKAASACRTRVFRCHAICTAATAPTRPGSTWPTNTAGVAVLRPAGHRAQSLESRADAGLRRQQ